MKDPGFLRAGILPLRIRKIKEDQPFLNERLLQKRKGYTTYSVPFSAIGPVSLITWTDSALLLVVVFRVRKAISVGELKVRINEAIHGLRRISKPVFGEVQLWICIQGSFSIYTILLWEMIWFWE